MIIFGIYLERFYKADYISLTCSTNQYRLLHPKFPENIVNLSRQRLNFNLNHH